MDCLLVIHLNLNKQTLSVGPDIAERKEGKEVGTRKEKHDQGTGKFFKRWSSVKFFYNLGKEDILGLFFYP